MPRQSDIKHRDPTGGTGSIAFDVELDKDSRLPVDVDINFRLIKGDPDLYKCITGEYVPRIFRKLNREFGDSTGVEYAEIIEHALLRLLERMHRLEFSDATQIYIWLLKTSRHLFIDAYRKAKTSASYRRSWFAVYGDSTEDSAKKAEDTIFLSQVLALSSLSEDDAKLLELRYYYCLSGKEAASMLGITHSAYRQRLVRLKNRVSKQTRGE